MPQEENISSPEKFYLKTEIMILLLQPNLLKMFPQNAPDLLCESFDSFSVPRNRVPFAVIE